MPAYAQQNEQVSSRDHERRDNERRDQEREQNRDASENRDEQGEELSDLQNNVMEQMQTMGEYVTDFVRERPLAAVGIAVAAGFFIGRLFNR